MRIMVVDDEQDVKLLFEQRFRKEIRKGQISFHFEYSGEDALQYLKTNGITDLVMILSDINMPGMNGIELLKHIKESFPEMTVYMITAYGDDNNHQKAMQYGCDDYLTKPLDFESLKTKITEYFSE
jgi:CheY-like chemotaxis protein